MKISASSTTTALKDMPVRDGALARCPSFLSTVLCNIKHKYTHSKGGRGGDVGICVELFALNGHLVQTVRQKRRIRISYLLFAFGWPKVLSISMALRIPFPSSLSSRAALILFKCIIY